jgi:hypothetical protein
MDKKWGVLAFEGKELHDDYYTVLEQVVSHKLSVLPHQVFNSIQDTVLVA